MAYSDKDYDFDMFLPNSESKDNSGSKAPGVSNGGTRRSSYSGGKDIPSRRRGSVPSRSQSNNTSSRSNSRGTAGAGSSRSSTSSGSASSSNGLSSNSGRRSYAAGSRDISSSASRRTPASERDISSVSNQKRRMEESRKKDNFKGDYDLSGNGKNSGNKKKRRHRRKKMGVVGRIAMSVFLVLLITCLLVTGIFAVYVFAFVDGTLDYELTDLKLDYTSVMYANDENGALYELAGVHSTENRIWEEYSDIPKCLFDAVVATEDKRFYTHGGVDWRRTISAFANMFIHIYDTNQGGSTITQQLVKNLTGDDEKTPMRKIQEIMRARYVEKNYSKEVILECYVNVINYGNGCYGIETASQYYFGHPASELTVVESAALAATIKSPSNFNPEDAPENNKTRREWVLGQMLAQKYITEEEYNAAMASEVVVKSSTTTTSKVTVNTWYEDYVIKDVISDLCEEYGYTEAKAESMIYNGGLKIYTTFDSRVQSAIDEVYADSSNFLRIKSVSDDPQSGLVVMDYNGHILGMMGGYGEKNANMLYNRAVDAKRPTGSTIKPLASYSPALEFDAITFSTIVNDSPLTLSDGTKWPKNSDGKYRGPTYIWDGLRRSVNTIAAHLVETLSPQKSFDYIVNKYHLSTLITAKAASDGTVLTDIAYGPMAIGSLTEGATVLEMTSAYSCLGNLGYYYEPTTYTKVTDKNGVLLLEYEGDAESALSEDTATIMNKMMQNVVQSGTAAKGAFDGWQLYGKTGTTSDTKDLWFIGGSAYYICGVWYGYDTPTKMAGMSMNPALKVWKAVMQKAHSGLEKKYFPVSSDVTYRYYCTETGLLATDACTSCQLGWYKTSNLPACTTHPGNLLPEQQTSAQPFKKAAADTAAPAEDAGEKTAESTVSDEVVATSN